MVLALEIHRNGSSRKAEAKGIWGFLQGFSSEIMSSMRISIGLCILFAVAYSVPVYVHHK